MIFERILVTTDFSESSKLAFDIATYQAKALNSKITLLHVARPFEIPSMAESHLENIGLLSSIKGEYLFKAQNQVEALAKSSFHKCEVEPICIFSERSAAEEIIDYAESSGAGLIVIASHGKGRISSILLGSTTQRILVNTKVPVLVVPTK